MLDSTPSFSAPDAGKKYGELPGTLLALTLATGIEQWTGSGLNVTLTDLTGTLGSSADEASWAITIYGVAFAIAVTLSHRLASYFGNRRLLTASSALYALASLGCAASTSLESFLVFRVLQGLAGGTFLVRTLVFITHRYARQDRAGTLRVYGAGFFFIGRFAAPILAGWFADNLSWRFLFLVTVPAMALSGWLFHRYAAKHWNDEVETHAPDLLGVALLVIGVAAAQVVFSRGEIDGWFDSPLIVTMASVAILGNLLFVVWQLIPMNRTPLLNLAFLRDRGLFSAAVLGIVLGMLLGGSLYVIPQYLRRVESHSAFQTGILMSISGMTSIGVLLLTPTLARMIGKLGGKSVMIIALAAQMLSMGMLGHLLTDNTPDRDLWIPLLLNGIFVGIAVPTLALAAFARMAEHQSSSARAIYYGARQLGASLGVSLVVVLIDRRAAFHSSRLIDSLFSRNLATLGITVDPQASMDARRLAGMVLKQSLVLTYADVFYAMAALAAVTLLFLPLLPSLSSPQRQPANRDMRPLPSPGSDLNQVIS